MAHRSLEFEPLDVTQADYPVDFSPADLVLAASLSTPVAEIPKRPTELLVAGEVVELDERVLASLARTIKLGSQLEAEGNRVDCVAFSVMLCGGTYLGVPYTHYYGGGFGLERTIRYSDIRHASAPLADVPAMKPLMLGSLTGTPMNPHHTNVRLSEDDNLFIQKFGDVGPIITDFETASRYYRSNHSAVVNEIEGVYRGRQVMSYVDTDGISGLHHVYRAF